MTLSQRNYLVRGFGSVVKHLTAALGIASSIPLTPTKITKKGDMYGFFLCISALHWAC